jgi:hypothetical protein
MFRAGPLAVLLLFLARAVCAQAPIQFVPPPMDGASYSLGVYSVKTGGLVRQLFESARESAFTAGLNGLITSWNGQDDQGKPAPPGTYSARGYAVGPLEVEGVAVLGNDWADDDENFRVTRVDSITVLSDGAGLGIVAEMASGPAQAASFNGAGDLIEHKPVQSGDATAPTASPTVPAASAWKIEDGVLSQYSADGERLRQLRPNPGEPIPIAVAAAPGDNRLYLLEEIPGWQRVRGLSLAETKQENGQPVSTWKTFFERDIHLADPLPGPAAPVPLTLVSNPLEPGKPSKVSLVAAFDAKGSYLATSDGLRLRTISNRPGLTAVRLAAGKEPGTLLFWQSDGAAWDEFHISDARRMMRFDAGEFEWAGNAEKLPAGQAPEPPDT